MVIPLYSLKYPVECHVGVGYKTAFAIYCMDLICNHSNYIIIIIIILISFILIYNSIYTNVVFVNMINDNIVSFSVVLY